MTRSIQQRRDTKEKQRQALDLRTRGETFEEIARQVGYSNGGAVEVHECSWRAATDVHQLRAVGQVLDLIDRIKD